MKTLEVTFTPNLVVDGYVIKKPMFDIVTELKATLTNGKLNDVQDKGSYISVTCPCHAHGHESHPSCSVYSGSEMKPGTWHCFTCGESGGLVDFIKNCLDTDYSSAKNWLTSHYGDLYGQRDYGMTDIILPTTENKKRIDDSILSTFQPYHPYMKTRKLTDEVIERFEVKYDPATKCLVFPVRDRYGKLSYLTRRSVETKAFIIDKNANKKDIYLLNEVVANNIREVYVVESQINALTLWSWGYPAVALIGAGTSDAQMEELNSSGIIHYILCYDNDDAGWHGVNRFKKLVNKQAFVDVLTMPHGRDVNDLTREEFDKILYNTVS